MEKDSIIEWWYGIGTLFCISIEISLLKIELVFKVLAADFGIKFETLLPRHPNYFQSIFVVSKIFPKYKAGEIQLLYQSGLQTGISLVKSIHCDHAGIALEISILGLILICQIYDRRHWDEENNDFKKYE